MEGLSQPSSAFREADPVMRTLLASLLRAETAADHTRTRPESLRRRALKLNSQVVLIVSLLASPAAFYMLLGGALMPFVITIIGLGMGCLTLALQRRGQFERAAFGQVYATLLVGLVLTLVDPEIVDFGLALALLAPVQAS